MTKTASRDARTRALRTLLQGLIYTVLAALVVAALGAVTSAASWTELRGNLLAFGFAQSVAVAGLSWLMRAAVDPWLASRDQADE